MPAHLESWWRQHPERWSQRPRHAHGFPADGTTGQQIDWFRRRFLKLADKASSIKEQGEFLKLAFMATSKGESAFAADEAAAQYAEFRKRQDEGNEEAHQKEPPTPRPDAEAERILRYFQTTPYRTKNRETPE